MGLGHHSPLEAFFGSTLACFHSHELKRGKRSEKAKKESTPSRLCPLPHSHSKVPLPPPLLHPSSSHGLRAKARENETRSNSRVLDGEEDHDKEEEEQDERCPRAVRAVSHCSWFLATHKHR